MSNNPMVSVITPVLNGVPYIEDAIVSVLNQTYPNVEHIIVDGSSTDGTRQIVEHFSGKHGERIRFVSAPDLGADDGFNKGCSLARGQYLGWLGSDDTYPVDALAFAVSHFTTHPDHRFIYGEADIVDSDGIGIGRFATKDFSVESALNEGTCFAFPAAFYHREVVRKVGGFRLGDVICDHDWVIRAGMQYGLNRLPATLCRFRLHERGRSASRPKEIDAKAFFVVNRRYGGRWLSPVCIRYFAHLAKSIPVLGHLYRAFIEYPRFGARIESHCRRFAVFGAAVSGHQATKMIASHGCSVSLFIDNFPPSSGLFSGLPVVKPAEFVLNMQDSADAVMIATTSGRAAEMRRQLRKLGFRKPIYCFPHSLFEDQT